MMNLIKAVALLMLLTNSQPTLLSDSLEFKTEINVQNLSKIWNLEKYKVFFHSEAPAPNEKKDYIHFKSDMTFSSISEGANDTGTWQLDAKSKRIYLSSEKEKGELVFIIDSLSSQKLVLIIDDPSDSDAQYLKIHFRS